MLQVETPVYCIYTDYLERQPSVKVYKYLG